MVLDLCNHDSDLCINHPSDWKSCLSVDKEVLIPPLFQPLSLLNQFKQQQVYHISVVILICPYDNWNLYDIFSLHEQCKVT